ncbi:pentatricopeptide repeat protein [Nitzschia inconspicua]|uniref:Pentatricopeptide repeat protein n=1 Tax=Nitzschia inconspicua TaxID=303405 RepID=A0A9K3LIB2_9STRA|nr:pentatricopeptide repeat protein [Nitzschia inconspicua]
MLIPRHCKWSISLMERARCQPVVVSISSRRHSTITTLPAFQRQRQCRFLQIQQPFNSYSTKPSSRQNRSVSTSVFGSHFSSSDRTRDWQTDPKIQSFLATATLAQKEQWLQSLLQSTNFKTQEDGSYTKNSSSTQSIDVQAFEVVLEAMATPNAAKLDPGVPRRAEYWMNRLLDLSSTVPELQPTVKCYQYVIQAWANSDKEQPLVIVNRSERWLKELLTEQCSEEDVDMLLPIILSSDEYQQYQEKTTSRSRKQRPSSHVPLRPTIDCFNAFLDGCTRGRPGKNKKTQRIVVQNAKKAEAILRRLISYNHHYQDQATVVFNTDTCNFVIRGWTRCKHDETIHNRVLSIVRLMETYQRENPVHCHVKPNTKSYSMALDALVSVAKRKARNYHHALQNQYYHHDAIMEASPTRPHPPRDKSSQNGMDEMQEAHNILQYMHQLYDAGVDGVVPHRVPYNILITGWAGLASFADYNGVGAETNSPPFKAEEILRTMQSHRDNGFEEAAPDVISYEKVIMAWANSNHPNAGKRASWWLKQLWNEHSRQRNEKYNKEVDLQPTVLTYNAVLKAFARTEGALATENMLLDLGEIYQKDRAPELSPNSESFAIVIRAWLQSADETKDVDERVTSLKRAVEWLSSLREIENEKNLSTAPELYSGVLRICRSAAHPERPFVLDMAREVFDNLQKSRYRADYVSYAALLQVGLRVYRKPERSVERGEFVKSLFFECCDDGLVSNVFLRALSNDPSRECEDIVEDLRQQWPLPPSWSRNVKNRVALAEKSDLSPTERNAHETQKRRQSRQMDHPTTSVA